MRLIDECKEEEDRLQVIASEDDRDIQEQIDRQRMESQSVIDKFEAANNVLVKADDYFEKARQLENETFELTQQMAEDEAKFQEDMSVYEKYKADGVIDGFQDFVGKAKNFAIENKQKVGDLEKEMAEIGEKLDQRAEEIEKMRSEFEKEEEETDKFEDGLDDQSRKLLKGDNGMRLFESKVRHLIDEETEQEDEDRLAQVEKDLEEFQKNAAKDDAEENKDANEAKESAREEMWKEVGIIEEIMADQTKFSAYVSTVLEEEEKTLQEDEAALEAAREIAAEEEKSAATESATTAEETKEDPDTDMSRLIATI